MNRAMTKFLTIYFLIVFSLFSCQERTTKKNKQQLKADSIALRNKTIKNTDLNFLASEKIPKTDYLLYPVSNKVEADDDVYASKRASSREIWNIVFYNLRTHSSHLLFENLVPIINSFPEGSGMNYINKMRLDTLAQDGEADFKLFYEVIVCDYNKNGQLDDDDPNYLFMSDPDGTNLQQISPDAIDVKGWKFVNQEKNLVEIDGKIDSNNDKEFDGDDREFIYLINLEELGKSREILPKAYQKELKEHYIDAFNKKNQ